MLKLRKKEDVVPIIKYADQIRLTGKDAENFLRNTGRNTLPTTLKEYQSAIDIATEQWKELDSPEGQLMAFLTSADQLIEEDGKLVKAFDISETEECPPQRLYLKDEVTGVIAFTEFGLEHYEEPFKEARIDIHSLKTETAFEHAILLSIKYSARELLFKIFADDGLKEAFQPFVDALKSRLEPYPSKKSFWEL